ncbi:uncharacterized protein N7511_007904 [Penicillium nucicola]|uniref:uncharacterized protein n=1 Tax=Penicillium nucicola TaxID=1850975 RepID=UPI002544DF14|nr:uncharacterized protein N7511_007904 [Penicillium nucicola]KAJ5753751.1 hypothetical protein N7511_007904 [Penicillium nucicola]
MRLRPTALQSVARDWTGKTCRIRLLSTTPTRNSRLRVRLDIPPPFPVTEKCPEPSCDCPTTPAMPEGLPIDHEQALNGTMAAFTQQLLVCTGQRDWTSRIDEDGENQGWGNLLRGMKRQLGRGGPYLDVCDPSPSAHLPAQRDLANTRKPFNNVLTTATSIAPSASSPTTASAFLFPSFKYIPSIPVDTASPTNPDPDPKADLVTFIRAYLLPKRLHDMHSSLPPAKQEAMTRAPELTSHFPDAIDINHSPTILICGHGGRDMRCGIMAPALESEFQRVFQARGFTAGSDGAQATIDAPDHVNIGLISHIGGHKYAGNVIVYIPPGMMSGEDGSVPHPLAGKGIWYGRVEPKHVRGLVDETVFGGRVVRDHFRGGIDRSGDILRL